MSVQERDPCQQFNRLCFHLAATAKENVYSASRSISAGPHRPFTVRPLQHFLILPCYMLYLLPSNLPPPAQRSPPSALSSLSLYRLHYATPLFLHPLSLSPFSFPLCALDRLALIKLIAMVIHLNGLLSPSPLWRRRRRWRPHRCSTMAGWEKSKSKTVLL